MTWNGVTGHLFNTCVVHVHAVDRACTCTASGYSISGGLYLEKIIVCVCMCGLRAFVVLFFSLSALATSCRLILKHCLIITPNYQCYTCVRNMVIVYLSSLCVVY